MEIILVVSGFYFYNPFIVGPHELYAYPGKFYEIEYPSSWQKGYLQSFAKVVYFNEPEDPDDYYRSWNYSNNSICISYYPNDEYLRKEKKLSISSCEEKTIIILDNQTIEVFYEKGGKSETSSSSIKLRFPLKSRAQKGIIVIEVCRVWNDSMIINPNAISPKRLLKKALPLLKTFKLRA